MLKCSSCVSASKQRSVPVPSDSLRVVTQNVDSLHLAAGTSRLVELHGHNREVACLRCGTPEPRADFQARMVAANPLWRSDVSTTPGVQEKSRPDGDRELRADHPPLETFVIPACKVCGPDETVPTGQRAIMKPRIVFFGESISRPVTDASFEVVRGADALLVLGTSLATHSSHRLAVEASKLGMPIAIVNIGPTRADDLPTLVVKVEALCGDALEHASR